MFREDRRSMFLQNIVIYCTTWCYILKHNTHCYHCHNLNSTFVEASHCAITEYTYTPLVSTTIHSFLTLLLYILNCLQAKHERTISEIKRCTVLPNRCVFKHTQVSHNKVECFLSARHLVTGHLKTDQLL